MSEGPAPIETAPPRISEPIIFYVVGSIALLIGLLLSFGGPNMMAVTVGLTILGSVLLVVGFCVSLFGKIEQRLIDVERAILSFNDTPPQG
jgi:hypothetical protein